MVDAFFKLDFFLDNNVPDSIGRYLQGRGHSVIRQRFCIPANSPDQIVAMTALQSGRVLVTQDKDFNSQRFAKDRFAKLSRVSLSGGSHTLLPALKAYIHLIENHGAHVGASKAPRLLAQVQLGAIRFRT
jgi:predicted nuclease of predicted toxin-antitoxin system